MLSRLIRLAAMSCLFCLPTIAAVADDGDLFLKPPAVVRPDKPIHSPDNRAFQGIPSLAVAPGGRLWATWYAGVTPGEDQNNYVVLSTSDDDGETWTEVLVVDPDETGPVRACGGPRTASCVWPGPRPSATKAPSPGSGF